MRRPVCSARPYIKDVVTLVVQCRTSFLMADSSGIHLYNYEVRRR